MLTATENERLTQVGPGTPMGALFRRYWHPIAASGELDDRPTKQVRLLGENLVLYKDKSGALGLIDRLCATDASTSPTASPKSTACGACTTAGCTMRPASASSSPSRRPSTPTGASRRRSR